jgi:hypothetical protein
MSLHYFNIITQPLTYVPILITRFLFLILNNSRFGDFVDRIYPIELEIKDTTDTDTSASYLDLHLTIDSEERLIMKPYDKRDYFNIPNHLMMAL